MDKWVLCQYSWDVCESRSDLQKTHQTGHPTRFDPATYDAQHPATRDGADPASLAA